MKTIVIIAATFLSCGAFAQSSNTTDLPVTERLCGKLQRTQDFPVKGGLNQITTKYWNLPHVSVSLYPATDGRQCCDGIVPLMTTKTGHWGSFEFKAKGLPAGSYWVQVEPNGRQYRMRIQYAPKKNSTQLCSTTFWDVDDAGSFRMGQLITLD